MTAKDIAIERLSVYKNILPTMDYMTLHETAKECVLAEIDLLLKTEDNIAHLILFSIGALPNIALKEVQEDAFLWRNVKLEIEKL